MSETRLALLRGRGTSTLAQQYWEMIARHEAAKAFERTFDVPQEIVKVWWDEVEQVPASSLSVAPKVDPVCDVPR